MLLQHADAFADAFGMKCLKVTTGRSIPLGIVSNYNGQIAADFQCRLCHHAGMHAPAIGTPEHRIWSTTSSQLADRYCCSAKLFECERSCRLCCHACVRLVRLSTGAVHQICMSSRRVLSSHVRARTTSYFYFRYSGSIDCRPCCRICVHCTPQVHLTTGPHPPNRRINPI